MRKALLLAATASLAIAPAFAQSTPAAQPGTGSTAGQPPRSTGRPLDYGPNTPQANRAYQGGGVVLQGAPGAPPPTPAPTPTGQTPRNAVPPG